MSVFVTILLRDNVLNSLKFKQLSLGQPIFDLKTQNFDFIIYKF